MIPMPPLFSNMPIKWVLSIQSDLVYCGTQINELKTLVND